RRGEREPDRTAISATVASPSWMPGSEMFCTVASRAGTLAAPAALARPSSAFTPECAAKSSLSVETLDPVSTIRSAGRPLTLARTKTWSLDQVERDLDHGRKCNRAG